MTVKILPSSTETWVGRAVVVNVVVSNLGGEDVAGARVMTTVRGAVATAVTQTLGSCSIAAPGQVACSIDLLARAATARIRIPLRPARPGKIEVSATASAPGDANPADNTAAASTLVRPGRPGPPAVRSVGDPDGAVPDPRNLRIVSVKGRIDVSEPGRLTVRVLDRQTASALPMLAHSTIGSTRLTGWRKTVTAPVGDGRTTGATHVVYELRLPRARLRPKAAYTLAVRVVDLEGERGNILEIPFRLLVAATAPRR